MKQTLLSRQLSLSLFVTVALTLTFAFVRARQAQGQQNTVAVVSAASFAPSLAPESIAAAFGSNLATQTTIASTLPLPTQLAGRRASEALRLRQ